ncbi:hypothetical protein ICN25_03080 [Polynucleobacter sp. 80A-SIGWE]|nr:hypothetical protein [Polynucleobacter sp. 80A-SIGWE]
MEISLIDILCFLKGTYKIILTLGATGLVIATAYLAVTPKQYEAVAQIAMAQVGATNSGNNSPLGINIEEPPLLISRLSSPASFPSMVLGICGVDEGPNSAAMLSKSIKLMSPKGVANVIELKTFGKSPEAASSCAQAIFELIKATQAQIVAPYIADAKMRLDDDIERLSKAKELVAKADKLGSTAGVSYLLTRDEIRFLLDEIAVLKNVVIGNQIRVTRLIAPIYASDTPTAPKKWLALVAGLFGGLFLGLILALACKSWIKLKADGQEQRR